MPWYIMPIIRRRFQWVLFNNSSKLEQISARLYIYNLSLTKKGKKNTHLSFIMAMPAIKNLITTRRSDLTPPPIMATPKPNTQNTKLCFRNQNSNITTQKKYKKIHNEWRKTKKYPKFPYPASSIKDWFSSEICDPIMCSIGDCIVCKCKVLFLLLYCVYTVE